jgi:archaellum biogenesis protein FlaJ (TadC family)
MAMTQIQIVFSVVAMSAVIAALFNGLPVDITPTYLLAVLGITFIVFAPTVVMKSINYINRIRSEHAWQ